MAITVPLRAPVSVPPRAEQFLDLPIVAYADQYEIRAPGDLAG